MIPGSSPEETQSVRPHVSDIGRAGVVRSAAAIAERPREIGPYRILETLGAADPDKQGKEVSVREVMEKAADRVGDKFAARPLIEARLRQTIGVTYRGLGLFDAAQTHLGEAAAIYTRELGPRDPRTLMAANSHANILGELGHFSKAEAAQRSALELQRRVLGDEHPNTLASMNNLANVLHGQARYPEAEELHRKTLEIKRRILGEEHPDTLKSMNNLADVLIDQGRYSEAEELARLALVVWEKREVATLLACWLTTSTRGGALTGLGRFAEAEPLLVTAYDAIKDRGDASPRDKRGALEHIIRLYESWDAAEPGKGYAEKAAEWRRKLDELNAETKKREKAETPP